MSVTKEKKQNILAKLREIVNDSATLVFVGFTGLPVHEATALRKMLRERSVGYFVAKKTLIHRALGGVFSGAEPELGGEVALAYGKDALAPAQSVREFERQYTERVRILGGVFAGAYKSKEEMTELASIPPLSVLRGMFVNVVNSPIQGLVVALGAIASKKTP